MFTTLSGSYVYVDVPVQSNDAPTITGINECHGHFCFFLNDKITMSVTHVYFMLWLQYKKNKR